MPAVSVGFRFPGFSIGRFFVPKFANAPPVCYLLLFPLCGSHWILFDWLAAAKTILVLSCLLLISPAVYAQYTIRQWNVEDGLPQSSVRCITQTHDGYLWIATWNGLA